MFRIFAITAELWRGLLQNDWRCFMYFYRYWHANNLPFLSFWHFVSGPLETLLTQKPTFSIVQSAQYVSRSCTYTDNIEMRMVVYQKRLDNIYSRMDQYSHYECTTGTGVGTYSIYVLTKLRKANLFNVWLIYWLIYVVLT